MYRRYHHEINAENFKDDVTECKLMVELCELSAYFTSPLSPLTACFVLLPEDLFLYSVLHVLI